jgi:hypothetical protein
MASIGELWRINFAVTRQGNLEWMAINRRLSRFLELGSRRLDCSIGGSAGRRRLTNGRRRLLNGQCLTIHLKIPFAYLTILL